MEYEKLKEVVTKHKHTYRLLKRNDLAAMYEHFNESDKIIGYEVFSVKVQPEFTFPNGTVNPAKEAFPSNESFGKWAWCFMTLKCADERYEEITNGIKKPIHDEPEEIVGPKRKIGRPRKNKKPKVVRNPRVKFNWDGKEYNSKSDVARILLTNGESKESIARKLKITVQTVHAVAKKMK